MGSSKAFTLVELLIVVAIIVLLLAILVPALSAAIASAERAKCAGNLGSIGRGVGSYVLEQRNLPQRGDQPGNPAGDSWDNGFRAGGGRQAKLESDDVVAEEVPAEKRPLYKYAGIDAFQCPNDSISFESRGSSYKSLWEARGSSYWMQPSADEPDMVKFYISYFAGGGGTGPFAYFAGVIGRRANSITQPHKLIVLSDAPAWFVHYSFGGITYSFHDDKGREETAEGRLHAWNNGLFLDGHVQYVHIGKDQVAAHPPDEADDRMQDDFVNTEYSFTYNVFDAAKKGSRMD
jgi:prepilin-type N-terminal cleavage/methylation domain-containing protein/prepilin-type processing-associated H-X9-DG protein